MAADVHGQVYSAADRDRGRLARSAAPVDDLDAARQLYIVEAWAAQRTDLQLDLYGLLIAHGSRERVPSQIHGIKQRVEQRLGQ
jgi:hypothetical protein